jgi:hypothetical protein
MDISKKHDHDEDELNDASRGAVSKTMGISVIPAKAAGDDQPDGTFEDEDEKTETEDDELYETEIDPAIPSDPSGAITPPKKRKRN